ncbi:adenine phosphoribosyltransferase [Schizosaccharomyces japonicus yFS275]|uniref:adenine phosphoribosyltransferase n=1 Tax=Schizosaccharomyces japonicus (strain yFS275 / FY16936) TaxID=402676 RepID=B6JZ35_SCHJY|nr:adenine phosphoribosyltransferase [Schizosaccharomyces japonicus yFS275]EEB06803.1 adenine phosphoribosyltransferase [Schizosaccharomyces japonicus yFS275]
MSANDIQYLRSKLAQYPDFPKKGILFEDILPIFRDPKAFQILIDSLVSLIKEKFENVDVIVGLEARGFLFAPTLALALGCSFVPVRKPSKLPGEVVEVSYKKEYETDSFAMQKDSIKPGQRIVVIDDILATGGTALAADQLIEKLDGKLLGHVFLMELDFLKARDRLQAPTYNLLNGQAEAPEGSEWA